MNNSASLFNSLIKLGFNCEPENIHGSCELILLMAHDHVKKILLFSGIVTNDFDIAYEKASSIVNNTLKKRHLSGVSRFYSLPPEKAIKWLLARLVNTVKSILTDKKNPNYIGKYTSLDFDYFVSQDCIEKAEIEIELSKFTRDQIFTGLQAIWTEAHDDVDFEWLDFVELCHKFHFDPDFIIGKKNKTIVYEYGKSQLIFDFEMVGVA